MTSQKQILLSLFRSGKLQRIVTHEILKTLPKENRQQFKKEGIPEEIQEEIRKEINKQLLEAGINLEELDNV